MTDPTNGKASNGHNINGHAVLESFCAANLGTTQPKKRPTPKDYEIDIRNIDIEELKRSSCLEPFITRSTCDADPDFIPSETIYFRSPSDRKIVSILKNNPDYFNKISDKVSGEVTFEADTSSGSPLITIHGQLDKIAKARHFLIRFADTVAEQGFKKQGALNRALSYAFGNISKDEMLSTKSMDTDSFSAAKMTINMFTPRTENQRRYVDLMKDDSYDAVLTQGPGGTGKTRLFLQFAMQKIRDHYMGLPGANFNKLILSIPLVTVGGNDLGAMPGDLSKKTDAWYSTYYRHLIRILSPMDADGREDSDAGTKALESLLKSKIIEIHPLELLRGKSFPNAIIALDEAQNATDEQLKTFMTRAEVSSRYFVSGDLEQNDLKEKKLSEHDKSYAVPSTVMIDDKGIVFIEIHGRKIELGLHMDLGHFVMNTTNPHIIEEVYPRNGFAKNLLLYTPSPKIACTTLVFADIQRIGVAYDILVLDRALRISKNAGMSSIPTGRGGVDACAILEASALTAPQAKTQTTSLKLKTLER